MNVKIACVGKLKERYFTEAAAEYQKRLSRYLSLSVAEVADEKAPQTLSAADARRALLREGERLLAAITPDEYVLALAVDGCECSSEAFADKLFGLFDAGKRTVTFVIGGSLGLADTVLDRADETLSLGKMTYPHRIARILLLEQLYRACKIRRGEAYHK